MRWIRGPIWDSAWILSAPLLGLLMLLYPYVRVPWVAILFTVNFAHALSPIVLAWSHGPYRQRVLMRRPLKFVGTPCLVMAIATSAALATWWLAPNFVPRGMVLENFTFANVGVPIVIWANLYAAWNLYHSGAQNFGLLCLYRCKSFAKPQKYAVLGVAVLVTVFLGHELARLIGGMTAYLFLLGLITVNHWTAAIGLAAHVDGRHHNRSPLWFVGFVLIVGCLLAWAFYAACEISAQVAIMALCLRGGLGIWHFLQDRWIWQMSNPAVRATIGEDVWRYVGRSSSEASEKSATASAAAWARTASLTRS